MLERLLTLNLTLNFDTHVVLVKQFGISKAEMKRWKVFRRLRFFLKGEEGVSAAQPKNVHDVQPQNESQMVDEHDRSTELDDLNLEDWPLEDSFKIVSNFLDSMPSNTQDTEPERTIRTASPSSVSSSDRSSRQKTTIQIYQKQDQQLEALEQQMDEISILLVQSEIRREKLLARVLAQMQSINADVQIHLRSATVNISNDAEAKPMAQPTKVMGFDPISLDTTTMSIAVTLPEYHAGDNGSLEHNLHSSDTKIERISISPSISLSQDSVSNSHFPGTKSLLFTSQLLPNLLNYSIEPTSAERGLQDYFQVDQPIFIKWLHSGSTKSRDRLDIDVVDHRGLLVNSHVIKLCFRFVMDVAVAVHHAQSSYYHGRIDRRDIGVAVLQTIIRVLRQTQPQFSSLLDVLIFHAFCMSCCYRIMMPIHNPSNTPFLFKGGGGVVKAQLIVLQFLCGTFKFVYSWLSSYAKK